MSVVNTKDNGPSFNGPIFIAIFRKKFYFANERFLIVLKVFLWKAVVNTIKRQPKIVACEIFQNFPHSGNKEFLFLKGYLPIDWYCWRFLSEG